jgi:hypothetical protein
LIRREVLDRLLIINQRHADTPFEFLAVDTLQDAADRGLARRHWSAFAQVMAYAKPDADSDG